MGWQDAVEQALPPAATITQLEHLELTPEPRNVRLARRFVTDHTQDLDPDVQQVLLLVTSELATNAVVHARTTLDVVLALTAEQVFVGVHDLDLGRTEQRTHDRDGGRGLALVEALACTAGLLRHPEGGKTAWAVVCREPEQS